MKQTILTGWTFRRLLYAGLGTAVIIYSLVNFEWFGLLFGAYFASMGIFAFGCAANDCFGGTCHTEATAIDKRTVQDTETKM